MVPEHIPPTMNDHLIGGRVGYWTKVNKCKDCGTIGTDYTLHRASPCMYCAGTVIQITAKWTKKRWWNPFEQGRWITPREENK